MGRAAFDPLVAQEAREHRLQMRSPRTQRVTGTLGVAALALQVTEDLFQQMAITAMGFTPIETAVEVLHAVSDEGVGTELTAAQEPAFAHPFIPLDVKPRPIAAGAAGGTILEGFQCTLATGEGGVGTAHHRLIGGGLLMALEGIEEHRAGDARICRASVRLKLQQRLDDRREWFIETLDGRSGLSGEGITQTWKGKASRQSTIEEHTDRPQIGPFIDGHRTFDAFRCHVLGRPQSTLRQGAVQVGTGDETEVGEEGPRVSIFEELSNFLNIFTVTLQQHVRRFDIPVYQTLAVQMLQCFQKFESALEEPRPSVFGETLRVGDDDIFEGEGADVFHDIEEGIAMPAQIEEGHHMGMVDLAQNTDFPFEAAPVSGVEVIRHHFDGHRPRAVGLVGGLPHLTHPALANTDRETVTVVQQQVGLGLGHDSSTN